MVLYDIPAYIKRIEAHKNVSLLEKAYSLIPHNVIHVNTLKKLREHQKQCLLTREYVDEAVLLEKLFLSELIKWFKHVFFKWFDKPSCKNCGITCTPFNSMSGVRDASIDVVEVYQCSQCYRLEYFNRYNDSNILLDTRTGRCHEHAQVFALMCKALKYDTRVIFDITDHIWIEVYSDLQKRWIHCDPSEGIIDKPLMYEIGWKKDLSYIIAIGDTGIQEVTWRYTTDRSGIRNKRDPVYDRLIMESTNAYQKQVLSSCTPARKKYLLNRIVSELAELLAATPIGDESYEGRQSGSLEWRLTRGEIAEQITTVGHIIEYNPVNIDDKKEKRFSLWYSANSDVYLISDFTNTDTIEHGWNSCVYAFKNIRRKQEFDWKKSYLARETSYDGVLQWRFDVSKSGFSIVGVTVYTNFFVCENGGAICNVYNSSNSFSLDKKIMRCNNLYPSTDVVVEVVLAGGVGTNAWQHAQVGRQSMDEGHAVSFGIVLHLRKV